MSAPAVIGLLTERGWLEDGKTDVETIRMGTSRVPIYGKTGGELRSFGGRLRMVLPGTAFRATIGARTTNIYSVVEGEIDQFKGFYTKEFEAIKMEVERVGAKS